MRYNLTAFNINITVITSMTRHYTSLVPGSEVHRALDVAGVEEVVGVLLQLDPAPVAVLGVRVTQHQGGHQPLSRPALHGTHLDIAVTSVTILH